jgi:hypothetical protein
VGPPPPPPPPQDYHRFHSPVDGIVDTILPIDGALFTVNPLAINEEFDVFTENKRVVMTLKTDAFGKVAFVIIGATMVGSIGLSVRPGDAIARGDEVGYFAFGGSTCIVGGGGSMFGFVFFVFLSNFFNFVSFCLRGGVGITSNLFLARRPSSPLAPSASTKMFAPHPPSRLKCTSKWARASRRQSHPQRRPSPSCPPASSSTRSRLRPTPPAAFERPSSCEDFGSSALPRGGEGGVVKRRCCSLRRRCAQGCKI